ncbi:hypothetical protein GQ600_16090 [Phytophthora cactorum]|nr:hypothetical protein GQ600_16090 [Phytophthora cactorum]
MAIMRSWITTDGLTEDGTSDDEVPQMQPAQQPSQEQQQFTSPSASDHIPTVRLERALKEKFESRRPITSFRTSGNSAPS